MHQKEISVKVCCFIDGLDEFDGNQNELIELIKNLEQNANIKFCLSSRPLRPCEQAFQASAQLRLQNLTELDIRKYVVDKLQETPRMQQLQVQCPNRATSMIQAVVQKADGVFLWVHLAVRELLEGFSNEDSQEQMQERLRLLPDEIEGFYKQMLSRLKKIYRAEASVYFQLILIEEMSLFGLAFAEDQVTGDNTLQYATGLKPGDITLRCNIMQIRLSTRCAGFLECTATTFEGIEDQTSLALPSLEAELQRYETTSVRFLHRTARDFLLETESGKAVVDANTDSAFNPYVWCFWASLMPYYVRLRAPECPTNANVGLLEANLDQIMYYAVQAERKAGKAQKLMMETLDVTIAGAYSWTENCDTSDKCAHWSERIDLVTPFTRPFRSCFDFVGFAACHGLAHFVLDALGHTEHGKSMPDISYLLGCALTMTNPLVQRNPSGHFELIASLLEKSADPNTIVQYGIYEPYSECSAFEMFLRSIWRTYTNNGPFLASEFSMVTEGLLTNGADVRLNVKCLSSIPAEIAQGESPYAIVMWLEMSVWSLIKTCLKDAPERENIEATLLARGAHGLRKILYVREYRRGKANGKKVFRQGAEAQADSLTEAYINFLENPIGGMREKLRSKWIEVYPYMIEEQTPRNSLDDEEGIIMIDEEK